MISQTMDTTLTSFADAIRHASEARTPLRLRGGGSKDFYGQRLDGEVLDTRAYRGIVDYDPTELVITARCGTPLAEIESALADKGQLLAFEPPHFGDAATLGGCIAAGLSGPRRAAAGAVRDFVLGATLMNARGEVLRFGGRVMKNVAGYDVSRLLAGSLGTLGLIVDISLKVLPNPPAEATLSFEMEQATALRKLNEWAGKPLPISASAWRGGTLGVRLSGAAARSACASPARRPRSRPRPHASPSTRRPATSRPNRRAVSGTASANTAIRTSAAIARCGGCRYRRAPTRSHSLANN